MSTAMLRILKRGISDAEARRMAEQQAMKLIEVLGITRPSVEIELLAELPGIEIGILSDLPLSGSSTWEGNTWHIHINADESLWRCRATLAHEFKHILDDPFRELLYPDWPRPDMAPYEPAEHICDYFAGCVLVPAAWLRKAWTNGVRDVTRLASIFAVSEGLIRVRIEQTRVARIGTMNRIRKYPGNAYQRGAGLVRAAQRKVRAELLEEGGAHEDAGLQSYSLAG
jgi:Zn-dependent peptidase ImmA (M78 family)